MSLYSDIEKEFGKQIQDFAARLHRHPELSFQEYRTTEQIKNALAGIGVETAELNLETGFVGVIRGGNGPKIALRADIDAIRQTEDPLLKNRSECEGIMHGCGHDTHTAGLLGAALYLSAHKELLSGDVILVFQPAEEVLVGAKYLVKPGLWEMFSPAAVFGIHNLPQLPVGMVGVKSGPLMSFKDGFRIRYIGRSGHTSTPQANIDPTVAISALVMALQTVVSRNVGPLEQTVLTVCSIESGKPFAVTIDDAVITGNVRTLEPAVRRRVLNRVRTIAEHIADAYECKAEIEINEITKGIINSESLLPAASAAAEKVFGQRNVVVPSVNLASEDFSLLAEGFPSFFYFVGSGVPGEEPVLWHNFRFHAAPETPIYAAATYVQSVLEAQKVLAQHQT